MWRPRGAATAARPPARWPCGAPPGPPSRNDGGRRAPRACPVNGVQTFLREEAPVTAKTCVPALVALLSVPALAQSTTVQQQPGSTTTVQSTPGSTTVQSQPPPPPPPPGTQVVVNPPPGESA